MKSISVNCCLIIIIISKAVFVINDYLEVGTHCERNGICTKVEDCKIAINDIRKYGRHNLLRCGFENLDEIVCCPTLSDRGPIETPTPSTIDSLSIWSSSDTPPRTPKSPKRKAEQMCEEYMKSSGVMPAIEFHIINGKDANPGEFPHMAALYFRSEEDNDDVVFKCGGSLISLNYVLTAAHCFECASCTQLVKVRLGVVNTSDESSAQDIDVQNTTIHPNYNYASNHNDIALVRLVRNIVLPKNPKVYPACLYMKNDNPEGLIISGWGTTDATQLNQITTILQKAKIHPVPIDQCNKTILSRRTNTLKVIVSSQICAIENSTDSCSGDSGGPLQIERKSGGYDIVGIVSWGVACASTVPGVYTRVSAYLDFIEEIVWPD